MNNFSCSHQLVLCPEGPPADVANVGPKVLGAHVLVSKGVEGEPLVAVVAGEILLLLTHVALVEVHAEAVDGGEAVANVAALHSAVPLVAFLPTKGNFRYSQLTQVSHKTHFKFKLQIVYLPVFRVPHEEPVAFCLVLLPVGATETLPALKA